MIERSEAMRRALRRGAGVATFLHCSLFAAEYTLSLHVSLWSLSQSLAWLCVHSATSHSNWHALSQAYRHMRERWRNR